MVRLIHCALASLSREVPAEIRDNVLEKLLALLPGPEMSEISRIDCLGSIQVLLLLSMSDELNGADSGSGAAAVWRNVGTATRMASAIVSDPRAMSVVMLNPADVLSSVGPPQKCIDQSYPVLPAEQTLPGLGSLYCNRHLVSRSPLHVH